ncbi:MAG: 50S ribosomal protein L29 [Tannerella sp.]|jgi:large subunit ribosomal protein L29|nr:50S ribosomal protein L29 [Tannerella sp.]
MKKKEEIKGLSTKELYEKVDAETFALQQLKMNHAVSPLDNPSDIKVKRRNVARLLTELRQREELETEKA